MRTTYLSDRLLNHFYRNTASTAPTTIYAGLLTAVTDAEAGTVTETTYSGYARQAVTFGAPAGAVGGRQITNTGIVTFPAKGDVGSVTIVAIGIYDAPTAGNLFDVVLLDGSDPISFQSVDLTTETLRSVAHGLVADQKIRVESFPGSVTLPAPLAANTVYYVISAGLTADEFRLSTTQGGAAVNLTAHGSGLLMEQTDVVLNQTDQASFAAGILKLADD